MKSVLLIFLGGGLGSVARYLLGKWVSTWHSFTFPLGTLLVNMAACFLLGFIVGWGDHKQIISHESRIFWAVGFCGGFSTFSTFSNESLTLFQSGFTATSLLYIGLSLVLCLAATYGGVFSGSHL